MFTGIIEELGRIASVESLGQGMRLTVSCSIVASDLKDGDSIAVNGVCLTALDVTSDSFSADVSPETLSRTTLGRLTPGSPVNLERAVTPLTRLGGHIVQGHVDARGTFLGAEDHGDFRTVRIGFPPEIAKYLVQKGSIAVEGISLTIADLTESDFDIVAKYVERMMPGSK